MFSYKRNKINSVMRDATMLLLLYIGSRIGTYYNETNAIFNE